VVSNLIVAVTQVGKVGAVSGLVVVFTERRRTRDDTAIGVAEHQDRGDGEVVVIGNDLVGSRGRGGKDMLGDESLIEVVEVDGNSGRVHEDVTDFLYIVVLVLVAKGTSEIMSSGSNQVLAVDAGVNENFLLIVVGAALAIGGSERDFESVRYTTIVIVASSDRSKLEEGILVVIIGGSGRRGDDRGGVINEKHVEDHSVSSVSRGIHSVIDEGVFTTLAVIKGGHFLIGNDGESVRIGPHKELNPLLYVDRTVVVIMSLNLGFGASHGGSRAHNAESVVGLMGSVGEFGDDTWSAA